MKWYSGKANRSAVNRKYKANYYYFTNTEPWYEIFVNRTWTGKVYKNIWGIQLVKDKDTKLLTTKVYNSKDIPKVVNTFKSYAEIKHKEKRKT